MSAFSRQATKAKKKRSSNSTPNIWDLRPAQQQPSVSFFDNLSVDTMGPRRIVVEDCGMLLLPPEEVSVAHHYQGANSKKKQSHNMMDVLPSAPRSGFKIVAYASRDIEDDSYGDDSDSQKENFEGRQKGINKTPTDASSFSIRGPIGSTDGRDRTTPNPVESSSSESETSSSDCSSTNSSSTNSGYSASDDDDDESTTRRALKNFEAAWPLNAVAEGEKGTPTETATIANEQKDPPAKTKDEVGDLQRELSNARMVVRAVLETDELGPLSAHEAVEEVDLLKRERDKLQQDLWMIQEEKEKLERSVKEVRVCSSCSRSASWQSSTSQLQRRDAAPPQSDSDISSSLTVSSYSTNASLSTHLGDFRTVQRDESTREISVVFEDDESASSSESEDVSGEEDTDSSSDSESGKSSNDSSSDSEKSSDDESDSDSEKSSDDDSESDSEKSSSDESDESLKVGASAYDKHQRNKLDAVQSEMAIMTKALSTYKDEALVAAEKIAFLEAQVEQWRRKALVQPSSKVSEAIVVRRELQRVRNEKEELKIALGNSRKARRAVEKDLETTTESLAESRKHCKEAEAQRQLAVEKASSLSEELAAARQEVDDIKNAIMVQQAGTAGMEDMESDDFLGASGPLAWMTTRQQ